MTSVKTPEAVLNESLPWGTSSSALLDALDAAGYVIVTRAELTALRASFPATDYHDTPPGI